MIRSAAKNFHDVLVVVQPDDYDWVLEALKKNQLSLPLESKFRLAQKAIALTARYDSAISSYLIPARVQGWRVQAHAGISGEDVLFLWRK